MASDAELMGGLQQTLSDQAALGAFGAWLAAASPQQAQMLEFLVYAMQLGQMPPESVGAAAKQLCARFALAQECS